MGIFHLQKISKSTLLIVILLLFINSISCGNKPRITQESKPVSQESVHVSLVILGAGDELEIKFSYTPELDETQTVRPDGKIALQLIGEVDVKGKTPSELQKELMTLYSTQLKKPEITVIVRSLYSNRVYVSGAVNAPGFIEFPRRMTALEAIMEAGGFDMTTAAVTNVVVIRYKYDQRAGYKLNLKPALKGKMDQPFFLEPYDIVYVPRTKIASVNLWIDQYIDGLLPDAVLAMINLRLQYLRYLEFRELVRDRDEPVSEPENEPESNSD